MSPMAGRRETDGTNGFLGSQRSHLHLSPAHACSQASGSGYGSRRTIAAQRDRMAEDELDEEILDDEEPEELDDDVDLDELEEDDEEELLDDDVVVVADELEEDLEEEVVPVPVVAGEADEEELEEDEDVDVDDVEASLDEILKEKLVVEEDEEDEDDTPEVDERGEGALKVLPKQPDEFVCQSCFLVKHPSQLADPKRMYCRDCV